MAKESKAQQDTVGRLMHEFKRGELESHSEKVRNPKQAIAIGLSEAGATTRKSPSQNRKAVRHTKQREREGDTAEAGQEGGATRKDLYEKAADLGISGRSRMSKGELEKALRETRHG